ncbi:DUF2937 family protein [Pararoseomonas indoligenes]|uniref:DUF2937 family protein n=1 Tax=Roseomonas indoligenes TaxID=2820811 RepID=A0A940S413_9PROT|nr:DUF2937 family protein [Pararoseomonas indoligenes]MBP0492806.1 DUF2937 family protein [Pararoseomonas indoligenes]
MRLAGRWLSDFLRLALGIGLALAAMQLPALTAAYDLALVQSAGELRRDIDARKEVARGFYGLSDTSDPDVIGALRTREPSNAQGLENSVAREDLLRSAHARLAGSSALLRPIIALADATDDPIGNKRALLRTTLERHEPQVLLGTAAATYGLAGLLMGLLLANLLLALLGGLRTPRQEALRGR